MQDYPIFNPAQKRKRENNLSVLILTAVILIIAGIFFYFAFRNLFASPKPISTTPVGEEFSKTSQAKEEEKNKECPICQPGEKLYKVEKDDTLWTIGQKFKIDWQLIAERNDLTEPYIIDVGQEIVIPVAPIEE